MTLRDNVLSVVAEALKRTEMDTPSDDQRFAEDLGADSLDFVALVLTLEKFFGIEIGDDEAVNTRTVGEAVALVSRKMAYP